MIQGQRQCIMKLSDNNNDNLKGTFGKLSRLASLKRKMVSLPFWAFNWSWQWNTHVETSWSQLELTELRRKGEDRNISQDSLAQRNES